MNESRVQKLNKSKNYEEFSDEKIKKLSKHKISN